MEQIKNARKSADEYLHKKNALTDMLEKVEKKTKVSRVNIVLGLVVFLALYLVFGYGTSFLATFIGFLYPAYKSIKALESLDKEDDTKWLTYWVVFSAVSVCEAFTDIFFYWIPLYSLLKCVVFLAMMIPTKPNGSIFIYERIIRPYVLKHEKTVDDFISRASDAAGDFADGVKKRATEAAVDQFSTKED